MADGCSTIRAVTQASHPGCPRSPGTLSAISLEWVSAISGMRILGLEIPEDAARKKDAKGQQIRLSDAIWVSPVFLAPESPDPFRLHVHARFSLSVLPDSCAGWNSSYRLREQLLMHLIAFESDYGSRPGIVQLPVR